MRQSAEFPSTVAVARFKLSPLTNHLATTVALNARWTASVKETSSRCASLSMASRGMMSTLSNSCTSMHKEPKYIVTGVNRLSRQRQPVCRPMGKDNALQLLSRYRQDRSHRGHKPYLRLRLERVQPIQLTIQFPDYESD